MVAATILTSQNYIRLLLGSRRSLASQGSQVHRVQEVAGFTRFDAGRVNRLPDGQWLPPCRVPVARRFGRISNGFAKELVSDGVAPNLPVLVRMSSDRDAILRPERSFLIDDAARLLGVSRRTVYYRIGEGRLVTIRARCGSQRVLLSSIEALLRERRGRATPAIKRVAAGSERSAGESKAQALPF